ncbi:unnamed protein product [Ceutorhynchus assimilis]|uniref:Uncharacterized protein n=1 Tax=Ceutorhynchus assimilis TaxID=467358 RepID=A0A9N9MYJ6_9CUCU|nr:unnamed protein product [Ceutorhynchus assimilis]
MAPPITEILERILDGQAELISNRLEGTCKAFLDSNKELVAFLSKSYIPLLSLTKEHSAGVPACREDNMLGKPVDSAQLRASIAKSVQTKNSNKPTIFTPSQVGRTVDAGFAHIHSATNKSSSKVAKNVVSGKNTNNLSITAAKPCKWFYVGNLSSDCTVDSLRSHMVDVGLSTMGCEKLKSQQDHISCF